MNGAFSRLLLVAVCSGVLAAVSACGGADSAHSGGAAGAAVSRADRSWIDQAHQADMAEMHAGELAKAKGGSQTIRSAAAMLYRDHEALDGRLVAAANALNLTLPTHMTLQQVLTGDRLANEEAHLFDHDFTGSMISAHQALIATTRWEIAHGSSAKIVALARQTLPVLVKHLKMMKKDAASG